MLQIIAHILGYDLWFYVSHLALHSHLLYPFHAVHHEKLHPVWHDAYYGHWFESAFQGVGYFAPWLLLSDCSWTAALTALGIINIRAMLRHDARGSWIVGDYHLLHHTKFHYNYGEPWLDWLFGTSYKAPPLVGNGPLGQTASAYTPKV